MAGENLPQGTEEQILSTMDLGDEPSTTTPTETPGVEPSTPPTDQSGEQTPSEGAPTQLTSQPTPLGGQHTPVTPATQTPTDPQQAVATDPSIKWTTDAKGNVVERQSGQIVASAGRERRYFENWRRTEQGVKTKDDYIRALEGKVQTAEETARTATQDTGLGQLPSQLGLNVQEVGMGLQLIHNLKTNPSQTIQNLLAEAQAMGHTVNTEGAPNVAPAVNLEPIRRMIDERLAPLTAAQNAQHDNAQAATVAREQTTRFMAQFPDAAHHQEPIARLLNSDPNLSLEAAYYQLKLWSQQNGLDFNQPLAPQVQALAASRGQTGQPVTPGNGGVPPLNSGATGQDNVTTTAQVSGAEDSVDDIVRLSMREAGYRI